MICFHDSTIWLCHYVDTNSLSVFVNLLVPFVWLFFSCWEVQIPSLMALLILYKTLLNSSIGEKQLALTILQAINIICFNNSSVGPSHLMESIFNIITIIVLAINFFSIVVVLLAPFAWLFVISWYVNLPSLMALVAIHMSFVNSSIGILDLVLSLILTVDIVCFFDSSVGSYNFLKSIVNHIKIVVFTSDFFSVCVVLFVYLSRQFVIFWEIKRPSSLSYFIIDLTFLCSTIDILNLILSVLLTINIICFYNSSIWP